MDSRSNRSSSQNCYAAETQGSSPTALPSSPVHANRPKSPTSHVPIKAAAEAASGNPLLEMSLSEAVKCITHFLRTDVRSAAPVTGVLHPNCFAVGKSVSSLMDQHPSMLFGLWCRQVVQVHCLYVEAIFSDYLIPPLICHSSFNMKRCVAPGCAPSIGKVSGGLHGCST